MNIRQLASGIRSQRNVLDIAIRRNIYLHTKKRVAGLKRDPEEVFRTSTGHGYGKSEENLKHIKAFLDSKYQLSDDLVLQVITHKSFGNGIKPYNEKLSAMGSKLLTLYCAKLVTESKSMNPNAVNEKNLDCLGSPIAREICGRLALGFFAKEKGLNSVMFWKSYNHQLSFELSGEMKVSAQMMFALIGAVNFVYGKKAAEEFIKDKLFNASNSIEDIAAMAVERGNQI